MAPTAPAGADVVNPNISSFAVWRDAGALGAAPCGAGATRIGDFGLNS